IIIATGKCSIKSTFGLLYCFNWFCIYVEYVSLSKRSDSAAIVLKTNDDLPEPERPVNTEILCFGISKEISFKLFCFAPCIRMIDIFVTPSFILYPKFSCILRHANIIYGENVKGLLQINKFEDMPCLYLL